MRPGSSPRPMTEGFLWKEGGKRTYWPATSDLCHTESLVGKRKTKEELENSTSQLGERGRADRPASGGAIGESPRAETAACACSSGSETMETKKISGALVFLSLKWVNVKGDTTRCGA